LNSFAFAYTFIHSLLSQSTTMQVAEEIVPSQAPTLAHANSWADVSVVADNTLGNKPSTSRTRSKFADDSSDEEEDEENDQQTPVAMVRAKSLPETNGQKAQLFASPAGRARAKKFETTPPNATTTNKNMTFAAVAGMSSPTASTKPSLQTGSASGDINFGAIFGLGTDSKTSNMSSTSNRAARPAAQVIDPELDSSKQGLPLMLKSMANFSEASRDADMSGSNAPSRVNPLFQLGPISEQPQQRTQPVSYSSAVSGTAIINTNSNKGVKRSRSLITASPDRADPDTKDADADADAGACADDAQMDTGAGLDTTVDASAAPMRANVWIPNRVTSIIASLSSDEKLATKDTKEQAATEESHKAEEGRYGKRIKLTADDAAPTAESLPQPEAKTTPPPKNPPSLRLKQRMRQIALGKETVGYYRYTQSVSRQSRTREMPRTPNPRRDYPKRAWSSMVSKWRRALHQYDPSEDEQEMWESKFNQNLPTLRAEIAKTVDELVANPYIIPIPPRRQNSSNGSGNANGPNDSASADSSQQS
jgi:Histone RNA hairpin-binding protein RNA-binding domain